MLTKEPPLQVQARDFDLLRDLFDSRVMTGAHIAALHFSDSKEAAKKRLQKLKAAGLIAERKRGVTEPAILFLTGKAFDLLRTEGHLAEYPQFSRSALEKRACVSDLTLRHELEVMDVKAAFHSAMRGTESFNIAEFSTWPLLHQFEASRNGGPDVTVKPDGFIRIHEKESDGGLSEHTFFLEVDRSSETQDTLVAKAACYLDYYRSGSFAAKNGADRLAYKEYPFRVLMVMKTAERRNNTAERLLQKTPPIYTMTCLATFDEVTTDPLGTVWITPRDYREAVKGTPFDTDRERQTSRYRKEIAREILVEKNIRRFSLVAS